jgi:hypothetical protein
MRNVFAHETSSADINQVSHRDRVREIIGRLAQYEEFEAFKKSISKSKTGNAADFCTGVAIILVRLETLLEEVEPIRQEWTCGFVPPKWLSKDKKEKT